MLTLKEKKYTIPIGKPLLDYLSDRRGKGLDGFNDPKEWSTYMRYILDVGVIGDMQNGNGELVDKDKYSKSDGSFDCDKFPEFVTSVLGEGVEFYEILISYPEESGVSNNYNKGTLTIVCNDDEDFNVVKSLGKTERIIWKLSDGCLRYTDIKNDDGVMVMMVSLLNVVK